MGPSVRHRKAGEVRTRTGCNKCRERRVKCPEEKPTCSMCATLGFSCSYSRQLRWQPIQSFDGIILPAQSPVEDWMFLHVHPLDFDDAHQRPSLLLSTSDAEGISPWQRCDENTPSILIRDSHLQSWLSPLDLSSTECHLWQYFHGAIAPTCVLDPAVNPYQDIILRIAASTGKSSPLFNIVMAISAREHSILGRGDFHTIALRYHNQAVRLLRLETTKMEQGVSDQASKAQILATVMALVFLDVCFASCIFFTMPNSTLDHE
jgi:hypothetical protein